MSELLIQLNKCGLRAPNPGNLPEIVFHDGTSHFPGQSMKMAVDLARKHFQSDPRIIFVLLPDTGVALLTLLLCLRNLSVQTLPNQAWCTKGTLAIRSDLRF